ncbi:MAG: hypothetical protein AAF841_04015 [Pseudomonadota bacterium]
MHIPTESFKDLEASLSQWIAPVAAEVRFGEIAPQNDGDARVHLTRLGWSDAPAKDRDAQDRRISVDLLVTACAPSAAEADGLLGALLLSPDKALAQLRPMPVDSPLWAQLGVAPRPALIAVCPVRLSPAAQPAPRIETVIARFETSASLKGQIVGDDGPVPAAEVAIVGGASRAETDASGHFKLAGWSGQPISVAHRGKRRVFKPKPGSQDLKLSLAKES